MLGTSTSLFSIASGLSIQTISTPSINDWVSVPLMLGIIPPVELYAYSISGRLQDVAKGTIGQIYVLNAYIGQNNGRLNRFAIANATSGVTSSTVTPFQDYNGNVLAYYANTFGYRNVFYLDGSVALNSRNTNLPFNLLFQNGFGSGVTIMSQEQLNGAQAISAIERNSAAGSFVVGANTGLFINE
jgi:prepilin-type processing-associated H-X9-DG protein